MKVENKGIKEIADSMLNSEIALPLIQRGFVWKPYQIENIWDSIFREYPVGTFLLVKGGDKMELFDGQQRATAIALGFYNPWDKHNELTQIGNAKSLPTIWVDLDPKESISGTSILPENSEHLFRVLTEAHPWGYLARQNYKIMGVRDRLDAWNQMKTISDILSEETGNTIINNYTKLSADLRLPYSSRLPVPLCFLLEAGEDCPNENVFKERIINSVKKNLKHINTHFVPYFLRNKSEQERTPQYFDALDNLDKYDNRIWGKWYKKVQVILDKKKYCVSYIILDKKTICQNNSDETSNNENPTLFVRLNSSGTQLEGEELIYSIFKSIFPIGKEVEKTEIAKFISPSRIIVLIARLLLNETIDEHSRFPDKINSRRFQTLVTPDSDKDNESLGKRMKLFIEKEIIEKKKEEDLFMRAINILRNNNTVPDVVVKSFIRDSSSGFLLLLNFLRMNKDIDKDKDHFEKTCSAICQKLYRNYFFGDLDIIATFTYKDMTTVWGRSIYEDFWTNDSIDNYFNLLQIPLIHPTRLLLFYLRHIEKAKNESWNYKTQLDPKDKDDAVIIRLFEKYATDDDNRDQNINSTWDTFLLKFKKMDSRGKGLLLIAQKEFIEKEFQDYNRLEDLEDTNSPWDWDHIYPYSWMRAQPGYVYYWGNSLGNYRAMSLVDNRSESNDYSPKERCEESEKLGTISTFYDDYYIGKTIEGGQESDLIFWKKIGNTYKKQSNRNIQLYEDLSKAVAYRNASIYQHFYKLFGINDDTAIDTEKDH